jgi:simple sugar transport system ATP-binding protein
VPSAAPEILGPAGVDGNGSRADRCHRRAAVGALRPHRRRRVDITHADTREILDDVGVGHIPEDRHRRGLVLPFTLAENLALHAYRKAPNSRGGLLQLGYIRDRAVRLLHEYDVRGGTPETPAASLSGGNQQKVVLARDRS